jgi:8-oxo-dGTP diphosphatase
MIVNRKGDALLEIVRQRNKELVFADFVPLTCSLVVAKHQDKYLLVFDRYRKQWEVPGGGIEQGEDPASCAMRELREESGQSVENMRFEGVMKFRLKPDDRIEYGALYSVVLDHLVPFQPNDEIAEITIWDATSNIGYVNEIDSALLTSVSFA